jgi:uncharacterized membrane protein required for colicin V production
MNLPVSVFDVLFAAALVAGLFSGRRHGMSQEVLGTTQWVAILIGAAAGYGQVGRAIVGFTSVFSLLTCYIMAYILCGAVIAGVFLLTKRAVGGKLLGSDLFGRSEYYLGMVAGTVRYVCILLSALAILNARAFSEAEVKAMDAVQQDALGSNFFPTLYTVQAVVFDRSLCGSWIKENLGFLLIERTAPEKKEFHLKELAF